MSPDPTPAALLCPSVLADLIDFQEGSVVSRALVDPVQEPPEAGDGEVGLHPRWTGRLGDGPRLGGVVESGQLDARQEG
jgi:hypothetical protein